MKALCPEFGKLALIEDQMILRRHIREERMFAGGKGQSGNVLSGDRLSIQQNFAIMSDQLQHRFHQGRLTSAIFANQCMNLPLLHLQVNIIQGLDAGELLCYLFHFQK